MSTLLVKTGQPTIYGSLHRTNQLRNAKLIASVLGSWPSMTSLRNHAEPRGQPDGHRTPIIQH